MRVAKEPVRLPDIRDASGLNGKRVLLRGSLNVPVQGARVANDYRLRSMLSSLRFLKSAGARIIVVGHVGRDPNQSLEWVAHELGKHIPLAFVKDIIGAPAKRAVERMGDGDVIVLENLRRHPGEWGNDDTFSEALASFADLYVNECFATCHRTHASIVGVPKLLKHFAGTHLLREVEELTNALSPESPSVFVLGGMKFATKRPLIEKFLETYDRVFVGGALANDFFKEKGFPVGGSIVSSDLSGVRELMHHPKLMLPHDVVVETRDGKRLYKRPEEVEESESIRDAGPQTLGMLGGLVGRSRSVLWNGPLSDYERNFTGGTEQFARSLSEAQSGRAVVGGGDTVSAVSRLGLEDKYTFVSTGGGSMLQFLANETLPGIEALR